MHLHLSHLTFIYIRRSVKTLLALYYMSSRSPGDPSIKSSCSTTVHALMLLQLRRQSLPERNQSLGRGRRELSLFAHLDSTMFTGSLSQCRLVVCVLSLYVSVKHPAQQLGKYKSRSLKAFPYVSFPCASL